MPLVTAPFADEFQLFWIIVCNLLSFYTSNSMVNIWFLWGIKENSQLSFILPYNCKSIMWENTVAGRSVHRNSYYRKKELAFFQVPKYDYYTCLLNMQRCIMSFRLSGSDVWLESNGQVITLQRNVRLYRRCKLSVKMADFRGVYQSKIPWPMNKSDITDWSHMIMAHTKIYGNWFRDFISPIWWSCRLSVG